MELRSPQESKTVRILLSYSLPHFDPSKEPEEHQYWGSSASVLARTLYGLLSELGDVTYTDGSSFQQHEGKEFDLFVGIDNHFADILATCQIKKSIYWAVNMHPAARNRLLRDFIQAEGLGDEALADWDLVDEVATGKALKACDFIICVGSLAAYNSYVQEGIPKTKIKMVNYGVGSSSKRPARRPGPKRFVYTSSEVGLRKGFDIVRALFSEREFEKKDFHLHIVGKPTNSFYNRQLSMLGKKLGNKLTYHGWVDSNTDEYQKLLQDADFLVFPALEEGQAGSVLDAIRQGAVPILSAHTGVDFSPIGTLELRRHSRSNREILKLALEMPRAELEGLRRKTDEYYKEFHLDFEQNLQETLRGALEGSLYPKVSFILPIFNKEKTIKDLLVDLDQALRAYQNAELHIFFDGCVDKTEKIVRRFYRQGPPYEVTFETTPNIFETKTNNLGLKKSRGKYCALTQDDVYVTDPNLFIEAVTFLDKNPRASILGTLAGVNYYPRGTTDLSGPGQIAMTQHEVYWRQDEKTDPALKDRIFEVDACMRGPLFIRKDFLEEHGYLDEVYAPLYQDDMDLCFRARKFGGKVYCLLGGAENRSLTMAYYDEAKSKFFAEVIERNTDIFYKRWEPSGERDYLWVNRTPIRISDKDLKSRRRLERQIALKSQTERLVKLPYRVARKAAGKLRRAL
jgi:glycosyltransferase involved in cell wall biosynthesis